MLVRDSRLARVMERKQYRSSDEHAWTFVYAGAQQVSGPHADTTCMQHLAPLLVDGSLAVVSSASAPAV